MARLASSSLLVVVEEDGMTACPQGVGDAGGAFCSGMAQVLVDACRWWRWAATGLKAAREGEAQGDACKLLWTTLLVEGVGAAGLQQQSGRAWNGELEATGLSG